MNHLIINFHKFLVRFGVPKLISKRKTFVNCRVSTGQKIFFDLAFSCSPTSQVTNSLGPNANMGGKMVVNFSRQGKGCGRVEEYSKVTLSMRARLK